MKHRPSIDSYQTFLSIAISCSSLSVCLILFIHSSNITCANCVDASKGKEVGWSSRLCIFLPGKKTFFHLGLLFYNSFHVFRLHLNSLILSLCYIFLPGKKPSVILAFSFIILSNSLDFIVFGWIFQPLFMGWGTQSPANPLLFAIHGSLLISLTPYFYWPIGYWWMMWWISCQISLPSRIFPGTYLS